MIKVVGLAWVKSRSLFLLLCTPIAAASTLLMICLVESFSFGDGVLLLSVTRLLP